MVWGGEQLLYPCVGEVKALRWGKGRGLRGSSYHAKEFRTLDLLSSGKTLCVCVCVCVKQFLLRCNPCSIKFTSVIH